MMYDDGDPRWVNMLLLAYRGVMTIAIIVAAVVTYSSRGLG